MVRNPVGALTYLELSVMPIARHYYEMFIMWVVRNCPCQVEIGLALLKLR